MALELLVVEAGLLFGVLLAAHGGKVDGLVLR
jgi:hypothetical protein